MIDSVNVTVSMNGKAFTFPLSHKMEDLGTLTLNHWWIDKRDVYGQRSGSTQILDQMTAFFWEACLHDGAANDAEVQQKYLLARLCPHVRSSSARRVFQDANLGLKTKAWNRLLEETDEMLAQTRAADMSKIDFFNKSRDLLSPIHFSEEQQARYRDFEIELFKAPAQLLPSNPTAAFDATLRNWNAFQSKFGRRAGADDEKWVLDALSYEARVEVNRCYSLVWCALLDELQRNFKMTDTERRFHEFLHLQPTFSDPKYEGEYQLFHGQVFGLHAASSQLLCTKTGREIVADSLNAPGDMSQMENLLNAISKCLFYYNDAYVTGKARPHRRREDTNDFDKVVAMLIKKKSGQLRPGPRKSDARG